jgi:hypothetical protein
MDHYSVYRVQTLRVMNSVCQRSEARVTLRKAKNGRRISSSVKPSCLAAEWLPADKALWCRIFSARLFSAREEAIQFVRSSESRTLEFDLRCYFGNRQLLHKLHSDSHLEIDRYL